MVCARIVLINCETDTSRADKYVCERYRPNLWRKSERKLICLKQKWKIPCVQQKRWSCRILLCSQKRFSLITLFNIFQRITQAETAWNEQARGHSNSSFWSVFTWRFRSDYQGGNVSLSYTDKTLQLLFLPISPWAVLQCYEHTCFLIQLHLRCRNMTGKCTRVSFVVQWALILVRDMAMLISLGRVSAQPPDPHDSRVSTHLPLDPRVYNNYKVWGSLLTFSSCLIRVWIAQCSANDGWLGSWVTCNYYICAWFISLQFYVRWSNTGANLRLKNGETFGTGQFVCFARRISR